MGFAVCEFDHCKTAKMRVGQFWAMLNIFGVNLFSSFDGLWDKDVPYGSHKCFCPEKRLNCLFRPFLYIEL